MLAGVTVHALEVHGLEHGCVIINPVCHQKQNSTSLTSHHNFKGLWLSKSYHFPGGIFWTEHTRSHQLQSAYTKSFYCYLGAPNLSSSLTIQALHFIESRFKPLLIIATCSPFLCYLSFFISLHSLGKEWIFFSLPWWKKCINFQSSPSMNLNKNNVASKKKKKVKEI